MNDNDFDFDPTDADLLDLEPVTETDSLGADDWDEDFAYSPTDDRYEGSGIPKWSAWA